MITIKHWLLLKALRQKEDEGTPDSHLKGTNKHWLLLGFNLKNKKKRKNEGTLDSQYTETKGTGYF